MSESTKASRPAPEPIITPEQIAREAQRIIDTAPDYGPYKPEEYAKALPPSAAELADLLLSREMKDLVARYHDADRRAIRAQTLHRLLTYTAAIAGFCAGAVMGVNWLAGQNSVFSLHVAGLCFGALAVLSLVSVFLFKPASTWKTQRLDAELLRLEIFDSMLASSAKLRQAMPIAVAFECFRRHLFADQRDWFDRRSRDKAREARRWRWMGWIAAGLSALGSIPHGIAFVDALDQQSILVDLLRYLASILPSERKLYAYFWFLGFQLTPLLTAFTVTYNSSDLARIYWRDFRFLKKYESYLQATREAAANVQLAPVSMFSQMVLIRLREGVEEWAQGVKIDTRRSPRKSP
jgi:hypothetical protein